MKKGFFTFISLLSVQAFAITDGTYECTNQEGVPANVYVIKTLNMSGVQVPYVEMNRFYRTTINNESQIVESKIKGIATVAKSSYEPSEYLILGTLQLELKDGQLVGCQKSK